MSMDYVDMLKYRATIWSFLKLRALHFTMSDIVHSRLSFCVYCLGVRK